MSSPPCENVYDRIPIVWTPQIALHSRALTECVQPPALCCRQTTAHPLEFGDDETGRATQHEVGKTDIPLNGRQPPAPLGEGWSGVVYPPARPSRKVYHCSLEVPLALHGVSTSRMRCRARSAWWASQVSPPSSASCQSLSIARCKRCKASSIGIGASVIDGFTIRLTTVHPLLEHAARADARLPLRPRQCRTRQIACRVASTPAQSYRCRETGRPPSRLAP